MLRPGATFPSNYPTSCLLGSVDVTDWLAQVDLEQIVIMIIVKYNVENHTNYTGGVQRSSS